MNRYRLFGAVAGTATAADLGTKVWARSALPTGEHGGEMVPFIDGYWDWMLEFNHGSAFSLVEGGALSRVLLSVIAAVALVVMTYLVRGASDRQRGLVVALGLMAGGALGNLLERIAFGKVTDFILWHWGTDAYWPVFNLADVVLVAAVPLFLYFSYRAERSAKTGGARPKSSA